MPDPAHFPTDPVPRLLAIMAALRAPDGCPWDREQTPKSIKSQMIEEVYELLEAIDNNDTAHTREELGDVLLHIVFQSQMAHEAGQFSFNDVASTICEKLIRRHPHVFHDEQGKYSTAKEIVEVWNLAKQKEKAHRSSALEGVPAQLPALLRAEALQKKAKSVGFDWPDTAGPIDKVREELAEVLHEIEALPPEQRKDPKHNQLLAGEIGDLLFALVNVTRHLGLHAEELLTAANNKFSTRFRAVEAAMEKAGKPMKSCTLEELDAAWENAKTAERESAHQP